MTSISPPGSKKPMAFSHWLIHCLSHVHKNPYIGWCDCTRGGAECESTETSPGQQKAGDNSWDWSQCDCKDQGVKKEENTKEEEWWESHGSTGRGQMGWRGRFPFWESARAAVGSLPSGLIDQWLRGCLTTRQRKNRGWRRGWPFTLRFPAQIPWETQCLITPCS